MQNPWTNLPSVAPFILSEDREFVEVFNPTAKPDQRVRDDLLPEPFLGLPSADIILLNLNPGFSEDELTYHKRDDSFRQAALANLAHRDQQYPFYFLDPAVRSPGHLWWQQRLRILTEAFTPAVVSRRLFCLEYFPYHSRRFTHNLPKLPSQEYAFYLLRQGVDRNALVIVMRARDLWLQAVPQLTSAHTYYLKSWQNVSITPNNCPTGFPEIVKRLSS
jgi:hypothetical protein